MTLADMVAAVIAQGGFDSATTGSTNADVTEWVLDRYRRMVADAKFRKEQIAIGNTVANQGVYALPAGVVEIEELLVGQQPFEVMGVRELWDLKAGNSQWWGVGGVAAQQFDSSGVNEIELFPVPSSVQAIVGFGSVLPADLAPADTPIVPVDFHHGIVSGAIATGLLRMEERPDLAAAYEQKFNDDVGRLAHRIQNEVSSGPAQILVKGFHW